MLLSLRPYICLMVKCFGIHYNIIVNASGSFFVNISKLVVILKQCVNFFSHRLSCQIVR